MMNHLGSVAVLLFGGANVMFAGGPDLSSWDAILKKYVTAESRVDYAALKANQDGLKRYVSQLGEPWGGKAAGERKACLINAYNALTVSWIVENYPVKSIWRTKQPFTAKRHKVDGKAVSLDDIEGELRKMGDPRIHSAVICASIGCPLLRREAYGLERLDAQLDDQMRAWLASTNRNKYDEKEKKAELSLIFDWYRGDFEKTGSTVAAFAAKYAPPALAMYLRGPSPKIDYVPYAWGLNDTSGIGDKYSDLEFKFDYVRHK